MFLAPATSFSVPPNYSFFIYKQPVYKQLGLELQKVKQHLGLKHVTISNFANKIFAYEKHCDYIYNKHISVYYTDIILFSDFIRPHISVPWWDSTPVKKMAKKKYLKN